MPTITTYSPLIPPDQPFDDRRRHRDAARGSGGKTLDVAATSPGFRSMSLSPPPTPRSPLAAKSSQFSQHRLRSNSGLALHTNDDAVKKYTDYLPDGSPKSPLPGLGELGSLDSAAVTPRSSIAPSEPDGPAELPIPGFLGREAFDMVMKNQETANKLWQYAASQGCGQHIEFLTKIREYTESLEQVVARVSAISTSHTSITAISPIGLPPATSKTLNSNMKHLVNSMPSLENVFLDSKAFVEQKILRDIFPNFVKHQLSLCTSMSMALDVERPPPPTDFPGLRASFCLTDPDALRNPIVYASDTFEQFTGYGRYEIAGRGCGFMQGPHTSREAVMRMQRAVKNREESVELVLNYRRDGQPFWNMLYLCPLLDASGKTRLYMGAQVDVSASVERKADVQKLLNYSPGEDTGPAEADSSLERGRATPSAARREESPQTRATKKSFFRPFKKQASSALSPPTSPERSESPLPPTAERKPTPRTFLTGDAARPGALPTPYSRFMVLQRVRAFPEATSAAHMERESAMSRKTPPRLHISYCSQAVIEVLGLGMAADAILHKDVFDVLAEQANSPSVTKAFKLAVRETVLGDGRTASMELAVNRANTRRPAMGKTGSGEGERERKLTRSEGLAGPRSRLGKMMTYWTPLKDAEDEVQYVMLVLSPMSVLE